MKLSELYTNYQMLSIDFLGSRSAKAHEKTRRLAAGSVTAYLIAWKKMRSLSSSGLCPVKSAVIDSTWKPACSSHA